MAEHFIEKFLSQRDQESSSHISIHWPYSENFYISSCNEMISRDIDLKPCTFMTENKNNIFRARVITKNLKFWLDEQKMSARNLKDSIQ